MYASIAETLASFEKQFETISDERKAVLSEIAKYVANCAEGENVAKLTFICTHNSRRSHLAQIWAQTAAVYYGIESVITYSGGTEATAFYPSGIRALEEDGFLITSEGTDNPIYSVRFSEEHEPMRCSSKKFTDEVNPQNDFCAVMTCTDADEACPFVPGASKRVSTPYVDPKSSDGTPEEASTYLERSRLIGTEMLWVMKMAREAI